MAIDDNFTGTSGTNLPSVDIDLSCKTGSTHNPEAVVDIKQDLEGVDLAEPVETIAEELTGDEMELLPSLEGEQQQVWVRIPVLKVEEWINKDGPADMTRTAKVEFPFEWGGESIMQFVNGFNSQNTLSEQDDPYDECRIYFYDYDIDEWVINHFGYVGGVGPSTESNGVGKFWVYDPADLMKGIEVSKSWAEPTLQSAIDFALRGEDDQGRPVGLEHRSIFSNRINVTIIGAQDIPARKDVQVRDPDPGTFGIEIPDFIPLIGSYRIPVDNFVSDIFATFGDLLVEPLLHGQKSFQINRHNMIDHMEWITDLIDARWWFEPTHEGPLLVIDATAYKVGDAEGTYQRRYFVDEQVVDDFQSRRGPVLERAMQAAVNAGDLDDVLDAPEPSDVPDEYMPSHKYQIYSTVDTLNNEALVDIKPFNTLTLYGEATTYRGRYSSLQGASQIEQDIEVSTADEGFQNYNQTASAGGYTESYPYIKVTYQPLLDRAGGYEYASSPVESDKIYLNESKNQAIKEFRKHLAEETEGSMEIRGEPHIMPFDYLVTIPACNDAYPNAEAEPVTWEVNGVKHTRSADEPYTTELGVSIAVQDEEIEVEAEYRQA